MQHRRVLPLLYLGLMLVKLRLFSGINSNYDSKRTIYYTFNSLGGIYVKFLQMLALNTDFMSGWAGPAELKVFEDVDFEVIDINTVIREELGTIVDDSFSSIESVPFAAGSFAQVYKATLINGQSVVIKVLKPNLAKTLRFDIRLISLFIRLFKFIMPISIVDLSSVFKNFADKTINETNYLMEADSTEWFYNYFRNNDSVVIPKIYQSLSTDNIITMDYIDGISLADLLELSQNGQDAVSVVAKHIGSNLWQQLGLLGKEMVHASLWSKFLLGDPHPGNVKLLPGNKIGLIDFGIIAESPNKKYEYLDLLKGYRSLHEGTFDAGKFVISIIKFFDENLANSIAMVDYFQNQDGLLEKKIRESAKNYMNVADQSSEAEMLNNKQIIRVFSSLINKSNRYGLKLDLQSASLIKAARTYVQTIRQFSKNNEDQILIGYILDQEVDYAVKNSAALPDLSISKDVSLCQALETVGEWIGNVATNDPTLYIKLSKNMRTNYV